MSTPLKKVPIHLQSAANRLLIKGGTVVNADDGEQLADVYIEDAKIKMVGQHLIIPGGTRVIDATDKYVIPGGVDPSVRLQKPLTKANTVSVDDFYRGTRAALVGGTTTVVDCVVPEPQESMMDAVQRWRGWAEDKVCCNYALRVAVSPSASKQEMQELTTEDYGINTFRMSLEGEQRFRSDADLIDMMEAIKNIGGLAQVHAESGEVVEREEREMIRKGVTGPEGYAMSHSEGAEEEAVMRAATVANQIGCPLYVGPVTSPAAAEVIQAKKARGNVLFGDTTPAAIAADGEEYYNKCWRHAAAFLCSPPLRRGAKDAMVAALESGLDAVCSDHCTFSARQKALGRDDFRLIPLGVNGAEERMSVLWERAVHSGKIDVARFVALTSANAAKLFNMYPRKGRIEVGAEADVVVWNPKRTKVITAEEHQIKVDFNVFEGQTVHGVPEFVVCQGKVMIDDGQLRVMQGFGRFEPLAPFCPAVYDAIKAKEDKELPKGIERSEEDMNNMNGSNGNGESSEEMPPIPKAVTNVAERAPSQHTSNFDLKSHPNSEEQTQSPPAAKTSPVRQLAAATAAVAVSAPAAAEKAANDSPSSVVRVKLPPGGKSSGFW